QTYALNSNNVEVARHLVIFGCRAPMFSIIKAVKANRAEVIRMLMEQNYNLDFSEYRNPDFDLVGVAEKAGHNELAEELRQYLSTGRAPGASPRSAPGS
ncbi:MAG TPA: hypothetical protein VGE52_07215, partial [Pirellulales bacterium]